MKLPCRLFVLYVVLTLVEPLAAQQVKDTGAEEVLPLKTAVFKDDASSDALAYLTSATILRFWIYKPGSAGDAGRMLEALRKADGVTEVKDEGVSGDYQEVVMTLKMPQGKAWFQKTFAAAGITHVRFNQGKAVRLTAL